MALGHSIELLVISNYSHLMHNVQDSIRSNHRHLPMKAWSLRTIESWVPDEGELLREVGFVKRDLAVGLEGKERMKGEFLLYSNRSVYL